MRVDMIKSCNIICFANDWNSDPLSKKHIMVRLARKNRILWVDSIGNRNPRVCAGDLRRSLKKLVNFCRGPRRVAPNIVTLSPLVIPFHGNRLAAAINHRWLARTVLRTTRRLGFRDPITWTFVPSSAEVAGRLGERLVVYHRVDEFSQFPGTDQEAILRMERRLMEKADILIVSSQRLYETTCSHHPRTFLVSHGVDLEHFRTACNGDTCVPEDLRFIPPPIIGFWGLIADWVDLGLVRFLAESRPDWSFVMLGKIEAEVGPLKALPNLHFLGARDYRLLPAYGRGFAVALLPFVLSQLTLAANPLKLREYLAAGLPVVSTAIPEAASFPGLVRIGRTREEILEHIQELLNQGCRGPQLTISQALEEESWDHKVEDLSRIVESVLHFRTRPET